MLVSSSVSRDKVGAALTASQLARHESLHRHTREERVETGEGVGAVPDDSVQRAVRLLLEAAEAGHADAQCSLGTMH